jgi:hypothetical protein
MRHYFFALFLLIFVFIGCSDSNTSRIIFNKKVNFLIKNPLDIPRADEQIAVKISEIKSIHPEFNEKAIVIKVGENELASQLYDSDLDLNMDQILFNVFLQPNETIQVTIFYTEEGDVKTEYINRTYAELAVNVDYAKVDGVYNGGSFLNVSDFRVPYDHKDYNQLFKYGGPGWESEKVGYRLHIGSRNATDIFGKKKKDLILHTVGLNDDTEEPDSYHKMSDWGMDILKVGSTLGIGSIATWHKNKINLISETDSIRWKLLCNGPILSEFQTTYYGWQVGEEKVDLIARTSIAAGSRLTKVHLTLIGAIENIVTGFAKHENVLEMIKSDDDGGWQYISSYGKQSLSEDKLGLAVFYNNDVTESLRYDNENHFVVINPIESIVQYYFAAAWEKESEPINSRLAFINYLQQLDAVLNNPIQIVIE